MNPINPASAGFVVYGCLLYRLSRLCLLNVFIINFLDPAIKSQDDSSEVDTAVISFLTLTRFQRVNLKEKGVSVKAANELCVLLATFLDVCFREN